MKKIYSCFLKHKFFLVILVKFNTITAQNHCDTYFTKVSAGSNFCLAVKNNGTLWAWGNNGGYQLGDGTTSKKGSPIQIGSANNWTSISAGSQHSYGITADGKLWGWGRNLNGEIGVGSTSNVTIPTQIGTATNWTKVSGGNTYGLGITNDGKLWGWGVNLNSELGDGTTVQRNSPVQIGTASNWIFISAGRQHSFGITADGKLWGWGSNYSGQLGDGTNIDRSSPTQIGTATNWIWINSGMDYNSFGVTSDNKLWGWGSGSEGGLGDGTFNEYNIPTQIGTGTNWLAVQSFQYNRMAMTTDGQLWAWGKNTFGQLGDGTNIGKIIPTQVGSATNWTSFSGGELFGLGLNNDGKVLAFGYNNNGELGNNSNSFSNVPVETSYFLSEPKDVNINPGQNTSFSVLAPGNDYTYKWQVSTDGNSFNNINDGGVYNNSTSTTLNILAADSSLDRYQYRCVATASCAATIISKPTLLRVVCLVFNKIIKGGLPGCSMAIANDGNLWVWGSNQFMQLGDNTGCDRDTPYQIESISDWKMISAGFNTTFGVTNDGKLWNWGSILENTAASQILFTPEQVGTATNWSTVSNANTHYLALSNDGKLWAWGLNNFGCFGNGQASGVEFSPIQIGTATNWVSVSTGIYHSLGLTSDGKAWSWGYNSAGQLGNFSNLNRLIPGEVLGAPNSWVLLSAGGGFSHGITSDGKLWGWGGNTAGQLGDGTNTNKNFRVQIGTGTNWVTVSGGIAHSAGITSDGKLWTWGSNSNGQLGDGTIISRNTPTQVGNATNWVSVAAANGHTMALNSDGQIWAWGNNSLGQMGNGSNVSSSVPVLINGACATLQVNGNIFDNEAVLYPNPSNGNFKIDFKSSNLIGRKEISIYTILGQMVYTSEVDDEQVIINLASKPKGIYIYKIMKDKQFVKTGKIIIE